MVREALRHVGVPRRGLIPPLRFQLQASSSAAPTLDENQFLLHFRKLTTFKDHELLDIFDTFGVFGFPVQIAALTHARRQRR